jgi:biopolymer transport protein ExbD
MAGGARKRGIIAEINVTPLVDIMLVLLIIFMLTAHLIAKQAIEMELPRAANSTSVKSQTMIVSLAKGGDVFLDDKPITAPSLHDAIAAAVAKDGKLQVVIAGDKDVQHGRIVWVLDLIRSLGVTSFAIQIDPMAAVPPT